MTRQYGAARAGTIAALVLGAVLCTTTSLVAATQTFCVLVPHFKDEYWLSVGYGLEQEAARQDIDLEYFEAGGYRSLESQLAQLNACAARDVDAILIGTVAADQPDLLDAIARIAPVTPVFSLVNEMHSDALTGEIGVDWRDMGLALGRYLTKQNPTGAAPKTAIYISGPSQAGWTGPLEEGLRTGLAGSTVTVADVFGADTGLRQQLALVETALAQYPNADYLIGSAPAIEAAIGYLANAPAVDPPVLMSTYISHTVLRGLMNGQVSAVAFDDPMQQGVIAIRQATSGDAGTHTGLRIGPSITLLTPEQDIPSAIRLSPADYFPSVQ
ncbi:TMAO reductase system periplasmic protein TorT [Marivita sp. S2033]|uniref:TMAO reductase system periplasmic protein TorT n=1 Tax=Marivita sp. S2033 TaxID=3373187 RepID=UPI003982A48F